MAESGPLRMNNKVTIVTGGSRGIGRTCAEVFAKQGSKVVIADILDDLGTSVAAQISERGPGEAVFVKCDVTNEDDVKSMVARTVELYGGIDCLINNAGIVLLKPIDAVSVADFRNINDVNIIGPFVVAKYSLPHLRERKGNIVNIASLLAVTGYKSSIAYTTTKGAIIGFTRALAVDEAPNGVRVNALAPGPIKTEMLSKDAIGERMTTFLTDQCTPLGRLGTTEEIANACLYFATDASYCTGSILEIGGGAQLGYGIKRGPEMDF